MKKKPFDCVEMMHQGAARLRKKLAGMTEAQELDYWREQTAELRRKAKAAKKRRIPV
jgi:hypothetical protein